MSDDITKIKQSGVESLDPSLLAGQQKREPVKEIGQDEFLQLLVTQLKNQDPLDPIKNEDFAAQLAQFSSLEQLVDINGKLEPSSLGGGLGSVASYLGHQVVLSGDQINVNGGSAGSISVDLDSSVDNLTLELLDSTGAIRESINLGSFEAGQHNIKLDDLSSSNGSYGYTLRGTDNTGFQVEPELKLSGLVTGFVPGDDPVLLVEGEPVSLADVLEVRLAETI